jgi:hypothetical protein
MIFDIMLQPHKYQDDTERPDEYSMSVLLRIDQELNRKLAHRMIKAWQGEALHPFPDSK